MHECNDIPRGKVVPVRVTKVYGGNRCVAPFVLNLGARCRSVFSINPAAIPPGTAVPSETGWVPEPVWTVGGKERLVATARFRDKPLFLLILFNGTRRFLDLSN